MIKIKNLMTESVITVKLSSKLTEAAKIIASKNVSGLVVVDKNEPVGILSEHDLIKAALAKKKKVKDAMKKDFMIISPRHSFSHLAKTVKDMEIKKFPVVENEKLVGLVTETDIVEATRAFTRINQLIQEGILIAFGLATVFFLFYTSPLKDILF